MKIKEKIKTKEKEAKGTDKMRWSGIGFFISSMFYAWWYSWFYKDETGEVEKLGAKKFFKFSCYALVILGILGLIISIYAIFVRYPKECEELKQLKAKEKQLEKEIENH